MAKQPLKKKEVKGFSIKDFKTEMLGTKTSKTADKELEWIIMPEAYQDAVKLPGIPEGRTTIVRGWSDTGKSTLKNCAIASAMRQGIVPIIFETEGNFDFQYAKDCGMDIEPVIGELVDEETGEVLIDEETGEPKKGIIDWEGEYFLFTNKKICDFCGDMDYSSGTKKTKKRKVPVIEDIAYIINTFLDKQDDGEFPVPILFVWDSVGSIQSWKSYSSKTGNNQFDAGAISTAFKPIFSRIASSKEVGTPYTNTFLAVNKIWQDAQNSVGGAISIENSGGKAFFFNCRLGIHVGGVAKAGTKKLKCTIKGEEYQYGTVTKISVFKNHLPTPYNVTYSGTMCCVHNGIIPETKIDEYKKKEMPIIIDKMKQLLKNGKLDDVSLDEVEFSEEGKVSDEDVVALCKESE